MSRQIVQDTDVIVESCDELKGIAEEVTTALKGKVSNEGSVRYYHGKVDLVIKVGHAEVGLVVDPQNEHAEVRRPGSHSLL